MAEDARISAAYEEETVEVSATPEDDFSFDGMVPRWLRRPRENVSGDALDVVPEDDTPPSPPEWLRDVSEDLDRQDRDDLQ